MPDSSTIYLNEQSVATNIAFLKKKLGKKTIISAVVKANAYGHGIEQMIPLFEKNGIENYSVFYYKEALRVYASITKPAAITVMGWLSDEDINDAIQKGIAFFVFNIERLELALGFAKKLKLKAKIHLEVETGMNRSGLNNQQLKQAINIIQNAQEHFELEGFCTHLAGAESVSNHLRIQMQLKQYNKMHAVFEANGLKAKYKHTANSAASFVYPKARMDMVRIGIMLYGLWSSTEVFIRYANENGQMNDPLRRILSWHSQIMAIKEVKSGEFVGYGVSYLAQSNIKTALVPIGYSMGYNRSLSNKGRVLIGACRCAIIGVVNMNMIIVDVSNVPSVSIGDEVILIGNQGELEIKVSSFSQISEELNYEILAHLPESIKREVLET